MCLGNVTSKCLYIPDEVVVEFLVTTPPKAINLFVWANSRIVLAFEITWTDWEELFLGLSGMVEASSLPEHQHHAIPCLLFSSLNLSPTSPLPFLSFPLSLFLALFTPLVTPPSPAVQAPRLPYYSSTRITLFCMLVSWVPETWVFSNSMSA